MRLRTVSFAVFAALIAAGCASKSSAGGPGAECELATDCADGLVCIPQANGSRVCSSDLSSVQKTPPAPPEAGAPPSASDAATEAAAPDAASDTASSNDTGAAAPDAAAD